MHDVIERVEGFRPAHHAANRVRVVLVLPPDDVEPAAEPPDTSEADRRDGWAASHPLRHATMPAGIQQEADAAGGTVRDDAGVPSLLPVVLGEQNRADNTVFRDAFPRIVLDAEAQDLQGVLDAAKAPSWPPDPTTDGLRRVGWDADPDGMPAWRHASLVDRSAPRATLRTARGAGGARRRPSVGWRWDQRRDEGDGLGP